MNYIIAAVILLVLLIKWLYKALPQFIGTRRTLQEEIGALKSQLEQSQFEWEACQVHITELIEQKQKLMHQKKSSEVRTGFLGETMLPLMEQFPVDPKTMRFLGSPIDYISFDYETNIITFVEVKTGESQLNDNQRAVKKMVEEGRVKFVVVRLNEKGLKIK